MKRYSLLTIVLFSTAGTALWAAPAMAPDMPDLNLPAEEEVVQVAPKPTPAPARPAVSQTSRKSGQKEEVIAVTNFTVKRQDEYVETMTPKLPPLPALPSEEELMAQDAAANPEVEKKTENKPAEEKENNPFKLVYRPNVDRDPTLSPDDLLLLQHRREEEKRRIEEERKRKAEAERRRLAELQRQRQLELERLKDPSREIRGRIRINGIIGQEVFIGDKVYTVGKTVLGARIVSVQPDGVVFLYKGQRFTKKIQLQ